MLTTSNIIKGVAVKGVRAYRSAEQSPTNANKHAADESVTDAAISSDQAGINADDLRENLRQEERKKLAEEILAEMEHLKAEMVSQAEEQAEKLMKDAEKTGFDQGFRDGYQEGEASARTENAMLVEESRQRLNQAEEIKKNARQKAKEIVASSEITVLEVAVAVAEKLLRAQLEMAPQKVLNIVKEAIAGLSDGEHIRVFINSSDLPVCLKNRGALEKEIGESRPDLKFIEFVPDDELSRGSCRVESSSSSVEFMLEKEKELIRKMLLEEALRAEEKRLEEVQTVLEQSTDD